MEYRQRSCRAPHSKMPKDQNKVEVQGKMESQRHEKPLERWVLLEPTLQVHLSSSRLQLPTLVCAFETFAPVTPSVPRVFHVFKDQKAYIICQVEGIESM